MSGAYPLVPAGQVLQTLPANQTAPASTTVYKMQGFAALFTPAITGNVVALFGATLTATATTAADGVAVQAYYGPMANGVAAPANAAAIPNNAVAIGNVFEFSTGVTLTAAADIKQPLVAFGLAKGLSVGQQYWFDLAAESIGTASDYALTLNTVLLIEVV